MPVVRRPAHAGSWYSDVGAELSRQLDSWLASAADTRPHAPARAIIAPHAGYAYSGPCAAYAYRQIDPRNVHRVFILGPSHHIHISAGCALTRASFYQTPLYDLPVDADVCKRLEATGQFERMSMKTDEDEHSIEMHLPYIAKVMEQHRNQFTIVPILVGSINAEEESLYGRILAPYFADPHNLFVISSDFCHWGRRFRYTYYDKNHGDIYKSIENLDRMGMNIIENLNPSEFTQYLKQYGNTICGCHPIGVLMQAIQAFLEPHPECNLSLKFLKYAQSSQCRSMNDSSVSYAAASVVIQ